MVVPTACRSSELALSVGAGGAAAGSSYYPLVFRNTGSVGCTMLGYPGVSYLTGSGQQVGPPARRNPPAQPQVTLQPDGYAHAVLQVADTGNYPVSICHPQTATRLRVFPPNETVPLVIPASFSVCTTTVSTAISAVTPGT